MAAKYADPEEMVDDTGDTASVQSAKGDETFTFFWGNKSPFSQWHPAQFVVDGVQYNCAEQYMMHQKAVLFKDADMAEHIMAAKEPKKQKSLGRAVSNFEDHIWKQQCRDIVKRANRAKFSQNEPLKEQLLSTQGTTLVEASPRDCIWGIGLAATNAKAKNRRNWRGKNWLGYALTEVREELARETKDGGTPTSPDRGDGGTKAKKEKFTFFWENKSPFSQWHPSTFTVDGHQYNCAEQYMMHQKAMLFKDEQIAKAILHAQEPRKQKALGRKVSNFDEDTWNEHCRDIVKKGNIAKFSQNADMKKQLLATTGSTLVEASPHDTIWGIGLRCNDPLAKNRSTWRGKNWLGFALTEVRNQLTEAGVKPAMDADSD